MDDLDPFGKRSANEIEPSIAPPRIPSSWPDHFIAVKERFCPCSRKSCGTGSLCLIFLLQTSLRKSRECSIEDSGFKPSSIVPSMKEGLESFKRDPGVKTLVVVGVPFGCDLGQVQK